MAAQCSDDAIFSSILKSMGIQNYDPLVITALNEYARRYAGNLLTDAKDYAKHADRQVITEISDSIFDDEHLHIFWKKLRILSFLFCRTTILLSLINQATLESQIRLYPLSFLYIKS